MNAKIAVQFQAQPRQNFLADSECAIERAAQPKIGISTKHRQRKARKAWRKPQIGKNVKFEKFLIEQ